MNTKSDDEEEVVPLSIDIKNVTITLTKSQGTFIKDLICEKYPHTFPRYCQRVGIKPPNFYNVLNLGRPCSLYWLNKLLSGINFKVSIKDPAVLIEEISDMQIIPDLDLIMAEAEQLEHEEFLDDEYD